MKRKIITTSDGSKTIHIEEWNEQYHSKHGAINEAEHVFIETGLKHINKIIEQNQPISILEVGFGTGLNAFLTLIEAESLKRNINYLGVEAYPVDSKELELLNYPEMISDQYKNEFLKLHNVSWDIENEITSHFTLTKQQKYFDTITDVNAYNLIYFDAFGARVQPELWTEHIFELMYSALLQNGVLVTYSAKGSVRRAMQSVGFTVERLPGPPGKREMLRASKHS